LTLAIAVLASSLFAGPAAAAGPDSIAAAVDSSTAVGDSAAARPGGSAAADSAQTKEFPRPDSTLVSRLRSGGYVIVFRHSITDWAQRDVDGEHFDDRSAQRNLSKEGEVQAARIGKSISELRVPVGTVLSSPMWRCRDTAQIAFGHHKSVPELFRRGPEYRAMRLVMLGKEPEEGKDLVLVTHQDLLIPIIEGLSLTNFAGRADRAALMRMQRAVASTIVSGGH
jgi:phosphohistidine phosphatase SixA